MSKEEREIQKMQKILELEVFRNESNLKKLETIEETGQRKLSLAEDMKRQREDQVRKRLSDSFNRVAEHEAIISS